MEIDLKFKGECEKDIHWFVGKYIEGVHYFNVCAYCNKRQIIELD